MNDQNRTQADERLESPAGSPVQAPGQDRPLSPGTSPKPGDALRPTVEYFKTLQRSDGYWWFALEANETIGAEFLFLMHYLGEVDDQIQKGICRRILDVQRKDGTWAIYHEGPADLSTTVECYFALKLAGFPAQHPAMAAARSHILTHGGVEATRVFTKIHLAMFGLVPWEAAPAMPAEFILLPKRFPFTIYSFSSWARATIVPLLVFMSLRRVKEIPATSRIDELFVNSPERRDYRCRTAKGFFSAENFFILLDRLLKIHEAIPFKPFRRFALKRCLKWTWEHVQATEDIYPALAYGALAFKAAGYENDSPQIRKPVSALKMFQQRYPTMDVPAMPDEIRDNGLARPSELRELGIDPRADRPAFAPPLSDRPEGFWGMAIHQQCCISPLWDTPWMLMALLEAGVPEDDPRLLKAGRWLMAKQITECRGDWAVKNPKGTPGGWSFEFENDYFPDVDDTIEVLTVLCRLAIPWKEKANSYELGLNWLLSMQNDDGGWGAFDRNQTQVLVNRIPFSDHAACLDPSSPDITGRAVEFLTSRGFQTNHPAMRKALAYLRATQEPFGGWWARWGINYLYGAWCAITGLAAADVPQDRERIERGVTWLMSVQRTDGGYSESPETYKPGARFSTYPVSVASQTAWALMGLTAGGEAGSRSAARAAQWLLDHRNALGSWDERHYTGTGFPNHFYIRYHGYRHFFPLLALARYYRALGH